MHTRGDLGILIPEVFPENRGESHSHDQRDRPEPDWVVARRRNPREYLNHTFSSALSWQHGTHTLKAGGLFTLEHMNSNLDRKATQGAFVFQPGGGFTAFQNFLRGNSGGACGESCTYSETDVDVINGFRSRRYEAFVQDTWRIHPKITLDLGLRYAFHPPLTDVNDRLFTFSPEAYDPTQVPRFADPEFGDFLVVGTGNLLNGIRVAGKDSPHGRAIYAADKNNLQPRIGGAWDPGGAGHLVVRAAYGMYFDQTQVGLFAQNVQAPGAFPFVDPFRTDVLVWNATLSNPGAGGTRPSPSRSCQRSRSPQVTGSWHRDGSTGTSACSGAFTPAGCSIWATWGGGAITCFDTSTSTSRQRRARATPPRTWCDRSRATTRSSCERRRPGAVITVWCPAFVTMLAVRGRRP